MQQKQRFRGRTAVAALLLGCGAVAGATGAMALDNQATSHAVVAPAVSRVGSGAPHALADMVQAVSPSVVQVKVFSQARAQPMALPYNNDGGSLQDQLGRFFGFQFGPGQQPLQQAPQENALGSGFIIDRSGIVVTNNHVVDGASRVKVQLNDGREFDATVLGTDPKTDIAVVKINGHGNFQPVQWGDSSQARVGDSVFAVGSPFGLGNTVTAGILSARGRDIGEGPYDNFLQVDAAINSGNSGGPLFDGNGRVIGMNTLIYSPSGGSVGIGFAIPETMLKRISDQIIAHGSVSRGHIGVALQSVSEDVADAMGMKNTQGALIASVDVDSPAFISGVKQGDIVRTFDGKPVKDSRALSRMVADARIGSRVPITVLRDGHTVALDLRIGGEHNA